MAVNTHSERPPSTTQQLQARLALLASRDETNIEGPVPSLEELGLLLDDRLAFECKQQIYQYLNHDEQLFAHWMGLIESRETIIKSETGEAKPNLWQRVSQWLTPSRLTYVGSATAGVFAIAILTPALLTTGPAPSSSADRPAQSQEAAVTANNQSSGLEPLPKPLQKPHQRPAPPPRQTAPMTEPNPTYANRDEVSPLTSETPLISRAAVELHLRQGFAQAWMQLDISQQQHSNIAPPVTEEQAPALQHPELIALGASLAGAYLKCLDAPGWQPDSALKAELETAAPWLLVKQDLCGNLTTWITE
ncbi:MAG: hypothetical protein CL693_16800 [Cellvibrionaceae bacterium]|nr:hypothetical protein [Cellvibrionaceae bacterium]|tara:strand:+ start:8330 stop:9247 length:918 start_codon:yes stop_codon:yes gene_type:complete